MATAIQICRVQQIVVGFLENTNGRSAGDTITERETRVRIRKKILREFAPPNLIVYSLSTKSQSIETSIPGRCVIILQDEHERNNSLAFYREVESTRIFLRRILDYTCASSHTQKTFLYPIKWSIQEKHRLVWQFSRGNILLFKSYVHEAHFHYATQSEFSKYF